MSNILNTELSGPLSTRRSSNTNSSFTPIAPVVPWTPVSYLMRIVHCTCQSCQEITTSSSVWLVQQTYLHPTVRRETPIHPELSLSPDLPFAVIESPSSQRICPACLPELHSLGLIATPTAVSERRWHEALVTAARTWAAAEADVARKSAAALIAKDEAAAKVKLAVSRLDRGLNPRTGKPTKPAAKQINIKDLF